jgi:hypothetical protein
MKKIITAWIQEHSAIVTIVSILVSIGVAIVAYNEDEKIKESNEKIELLSNEMNSAIMRMELVLNSIENNFAETEMKDYSNPKSNDSNVILQVKEQWENGDKLMGNK